MTFQSTQTARVAQRIDLRSVRNLGPPHFLMLDVVRNSRPSVQKLFWIQTNQIKYFQFADGLANCVSIENCIGQGLITIPRGESDVRTLCNGHHYGGVGHFD